MWMRQILAQKARQKNRHNWPIDESAGQVPEGWPGWPGGKKFAVVLTHDVEGSLGVARCRDLMRLEMELGFRSSFNLIPEGEYRVPPDLLDDLKQHGFEVGVHDLKHDGKLFQSREQFTENAKSINRYLAAWGARGFRAGFMLHKTEWLKDLEVEYDASTFDTDPFEPQPDAAHTIFPFWVAGTQGKGYVELPYTLPQDSTMFFVLKERGPDLWKAKLDWVAQRGGMVLLIVHPDYINFENRKCRAREFPADHYRELLKHIRDNHAGQYWHALPKDLARWYADATGRRAKSGETVAWDENSPAFASLKARLPERRMSLAELAAFEEILGKRPVPGGSNRWSPVRPFFFRPLPRFQEIPKDRVKPPWFSRLGGYQHVVPAGNESNSFINCLMFEHPSSYSLASLDYNRKRQVRLAARHFDIRPMEEVEDFKRKAYPVYLSFLERTRYQYGSQRKDESVFRWWADQVFKSGKVNVLGGFRQDVLGGVSMSLLVEDTLHFSMFFCDTDSLRLGLPDLMLHAIRLLAAGNPQIARIFVGMHRGGGGLDDFYRLRGCSIVRKPARLYLNPVTNLVLRHVFRNQFARLQGDTAMESHPAAVSGLPEGAPPSKQTSAVPADDPRLISKS